MRVQCTSAKLEVRLGMLELELDIRTTADHEFMEHFTSLASSERRKYPHVFWCISEGITKLSRGIA